MPRERYRMKSRLLIWSITASLAGFLFGFDTIVISGAEEDFQRLWQLDGFRHGLCMSAALWGTVIGSIFGGIPAATYGRRKSLIVVGGFYFVSAIASAIAPGPWTFIIARFLGGLGVGAATIAAPMFISEISPAKNRGKLAACSSSTSCSAFWWPLLPTGPLGTPPPKPLPGG